MTKMQTGITCTAYQMVTAELRYECIMRSFLIDECRITEVFNGYIVNFVKHIPSTSPDMMLVDEELQYPLLHNRKLKVSKRYAYHKKKKKKKKRVSHARTEISSANDHHTQKHDRNRRRESANDRGQTPITKFRSPDSTHRKLKNCEVGMLILQFEAARIRRRN
ncbi:hypothetical protein TNCV_492851 [Trichonephila clavipes]|nr:hypothetical protein TNCV_492851 [Trichonephila clavipes]